MSRLTLVYIQLFPPPGGLVPFPYIKKLGCEAGAVALLLGEPFFIKHLYRMLDTVLIECAHTRCLPKYHPTLAALIQLILMAEMAPNMYSTGVMEVPAITTSLVRNLAVKLVLLHLQVSACSWGTRDQ